MEETKGRKTNRKSYKVIGKIILWQTFREKTDFKTFCGRLPNPFVLNATFSLPPPENIGKPYGFLMFSGGRQKCIGN